jgi:hypothetical protein
MLNAYPEGATAVADRSRVTTAFERTLLPGFAEWFVKRVESYKPDYLIPAETKGARVLDVVLDYAREELGVPISVPVLYRSALPYVDRDELSGSKVLVLDDAKRTGKSFERHSRRLAEFGVAEIGAAICVSFDPSTEVDESPDREAYVQVSDPDLYKDYVCQMTELVIASGLPPEVDHHVLDLELPDRLPSIWGRLEDLLAGYGHLSVDAREEQWGSMRPMTLHFPDLPGTTAFPETGAVRDDGPCKIRLFPDEARNRVVVVPVSFPTLDLPATAASTPLSVEEARAQAREWSQTEGSLAETLLDSAVRRDPETVFRALSAFAEIDLACGLARVIAGEFAGPVAFRPQRDLIECLYGESASGGVADELERALAAALDEPVETPQAPPSVPMFVDREVVATTNRIAKDLRAEFDARTEKLGHEPPERVGRSLIGISSALEVKALLASRCIDFGLALTTIVPYVDVELRDGLVRVSRRYRVSEQESDREVDNQLIAEEILAYTAVHLGKRTSRFAEAPLSLAVATRILAILRAPLASKNVRLEICSTAEGMNVEVWRGERRVPLQTATSRMFVVGHEGIEPTGYFRRRLANKDLLLDKRGLAIPLEGFLEALKPLLDSAELDDEELERILTAAAASGDHRLGLSHVRQLLYSVLDALEARLNVIVREHDHDAEGVAARVSSLTDGARRHLQCLERDWATRVNDIWPDPIRTEDALLASIAVPKRAVGPVYQVPAALVDAVGAAAVMVDRLDSLSAEHYDGEAPGDLPELILSSAAQLRQALCSLKTPPSAPPLSGDARARISAAGESLLDTVGALRAFAAAIAGSYCGPRRGESLQEAVEDDRFHTVLYPDLAGSTEYARRHPFEHNYEWKNTGLGIFAQWGRAFGGMETRDRQGDCQWMEFEDRGDPAVICAAATCVHTAALRATELAYLSWRPHMGAHFGRIKDADIGNAVSLARDEMDELCRVGHDSSGKRMNVTRKVLEACSEEVRAAGNESSLVEVVRAEGVELSGDAADLHSLEADGIVEEYARCLREVAATVAALEEPAGSEADAHRVELPAGEEPIASSGSAS